MAVPNILALTKQFARLHIAELAFRQVRALSEHMIEEHLDPFALIFTPQMCGVFPHTCERS